MVASFSARTPITCPERSQTCTRSRLQTPPSFFQCIQAPGTRCTESGPYRCPGSNWHHSLCCWGCRASRSTPCTRSLGLPSSLCLSFWPPLRWAPAEWGGQGGGSLGTASWVGSMGQSPHWGLQVWTSHPLPISRPKGLGCYCSGSGLGWGLPALGSLCCLAASLGAQREESPHGPPEPELRLPLHFQIPGCQQRWCSSPCRLFWALQAQLG